MLADKLKNLTLITATTARNSSYVIPGLYDLSVEDANWVLTSSFIIFTMQTGRNIALLIIKFTSFR